MTDQLISFETAKLAKEKGFEQNPFTAFNSHIRCAYGPEYTDGSNIKLRTILFNPETNIAVAPTQSLLQKWLREKHNIHIVVIPFARDSSNIKSKSDYYVYVNKKQFYGFINITANDKPYKTYEEALEQGLIEALKMIK